jgi:hypothetical protein
VGQPEGSCGASEGIPAAGATASVCCPSTEQQSGSACAQFALSLAQRYKGVWTPTCTGTPHHLRGQAISTGDFYCGAEFHCRVEAVRDTNSSARQRVGEATYARKECESENEPARKRSWKTDLNVYRRGFPTPSVSVLPHDSRPAPAMFTTAINDALKHTRSMHTTPAKTACGERYR